MSTVADRVIQVLTTSPAGFFSDFDGVLSEIAPTPDSAVAFPGAADAMRTISHHVTAAGIITGRAVDSVATMLSIDDYIVVGNHGLEWWEQGRRSDHPAGLRAINAITHVMDETRRQIEAAIDTDGMIWENKRLSSTVHFRNTADPEAVEQALLPIVVPLAEENDLRVTFGKMIVEFRPQEHVSKGTALAELIQRHDLQSIVFAGDDVTDVDGFRTLSEMRQQGKNTLSVGVVTIDSHPDVAAYADVIVGSVSEFVEMLSGVASQLELLDA